MEAHVSDSVAVADGFNGEEILPSQSQHHPGVLDFAAGNHKINIAMQEEEEEEDKQEQPLKSEQAVDSLKDKTSLAAAGEEQGSALELEQVELKKKSLFDQLQSLLLSLPKDDFFAARKTTLQPQQHLPFPPSLGIEVIDETALLHTLPAPSSTSVGVPKKTTTTKKDNGKQSRRRAAKKDASHSHRSVTVTVAEETAPDGTKPIKTTKYSRKQMEALRFLNVAQQRKFWKSIYAGLQSAVANEYNTLATSHQHNKPAPPILSVGAANGRWRYMNVFVH